jgi:UDP-N-acetylmuramyl pentapeptide phosphotransferase/UDP-N-acetylglucosamine-1-phosphate transferase
MILTVVSFLYLKIAAKYKITDKPNKRSVHTKVTVRGGGILFPLAIFLFFIFNKYQYPYFIFSVVIISISSFLDDIYTLSSKIRFPFQFIAVYLALYEVGLPFDPIYMFVIYFVTGIGIVNMFNFMDGVNGITAAYSLSSLAGIFVLNRLENAIDQDLLIYITLAILVFSCYNFRKRALLFAGDVGSIVMGLLIMFLVYKLVFAVNSLLVLLFVLLYVIDAGLTLGHRFFYTKESVLVAHREHLYEKLVTTKQMSHLQVSLTYAVIQLFVNAIVYYSYMLPMYSQIIIFICLISLFVIIYIFIFRRLKNKLK